MAKKTLDLHGIKHEEARRQTISFIDGLLKDQEICDIEIITGHSEDMRKIVIEVLEEYKLDYYVGGYFGINVAIITAKID